MLDDTVLGNADAVKRRANGTDAAENGNPFECADDPRDKGPPTTMGPIPGTKRNAEPNSNPPYLTLSPVLYYPTTCSSE